MQSIFVQYSTEYKLKRKRLKHVIYGIWDELHIELLKLNFSYKPGYFEKHNNFIKLLSSILNK